MKGVAERHEKRRRTVFGANRFIRTVKSFGQPTESRSQLCRGLNATKRYSVEGFRPLVHPRAARAASGQDRRAAEEREEFASFHRITSRQAGETAALRHFNAVYVCSGVKMRRTRNNALQRAAI
jgi:hypothetical protein